jgi:hypothetical protein
MARRPDGSRPAARRAPSPVTLRDPQEQGVRVLHRLLCQPAGQFPEGESTAVSGALLSAASAIRSGSMQGGCKVANVVPELHGRLR